MITLYIPTALTLLRILIAPCLAWDIVAQHKKRALILFLIAAATDFLDGFLARLWKTETKIGALLDPLADKIVIMCCYGSLFFNQTTQIIIPAWFILIIGIKELLLIVGSLYGIAQKKHLALQPSILGKATMTLQVCFISLISLYNYAYPGYSLPFFSFWLYAIIGMTLLSFMHYVFINYKKITL